MRTIELFSLVILFVYVLRILKFKHYWETYTEFRPSGNHKGIAISVIIAFRNEVTKIDALLLSLEKQGYPAGLFEIILVNDDSDVDRLADILKVLDRRLPLHPKPEPDVGGH